MAHIEKRAAFDDGSAIDRAVADQAGPGIKREGKSGA